MVQIPARGQVQAILQRTRATAAPSQPVSLLPAILSADTAIRLLFLEHLQAQR